MNYDEWKTTKDFEFEHHCPECTDQDYAKAHALDHFEGVLNHLYGKKKLNDELLEFNIMEICEYFKLEMPSGHVTIVRDPYYQEIRELNNLKTKV